MFDKYVSNLKNSTFGIIPKRLYGYEIWLVICIVAYVISSIFNGVAVNEKISLIYRQGFENLLVPYHILSVFFSLVFPIVLLNSILKRRHCSKDFAYLIVLFSLINQLFNLGIFNIFDSINAFMVFLNGLMISFALFIPFINKLSRMKSVIFVIAVAFIASELSSFINMIYCGDFEYNSVSLMVFSIANSSFMMSLLYFIIADDYNAKIINNIKIFGRKSGLIGLWLLPVLIMGGFISGDYDMDYDRYLTPIGFIFLIVLIFIKMYIFVSFLTELIKARTREKKEQIEKNETESEEALDNEIISDDKSEITDKKSNSGENLKYIIIASALILIFSVVSNIIENNKAYEKSLAYLYAGDKYSFFGDIKSHKEIWKKAGEDYCEYVGEDYGEIKSIEHIVTSGWESPDLYSTYSAYNVKFDNYEITIVD